MCSMCINLKIVGAIILSMTLNLFQVLISYIHQNCFSVFNFLINVTRMQWPFFSYSHKLVSIFETWHIRLLHNILVKFLYIFLWVHKSVIFIFCRLLPMNLINLQVILTSKSPVIPKIHPREYKIFAWTGSVRFCSKSEIPCKKDQVD